MCHIGNAIIGKIDKVVERKREATLTVSAKNFLDGLILIFILVNEQENYSMKTHYGTFAEGN